MNISHMAQAAPLIPPTEDAFRPLMRLIPIGIGQIECPKMAALCRWTADLILALITSGAFDTPDEQHRLAALGLTKDALHRFAMWLLRRAGEMDCGEAH